MKPHGKAGVGEWAGWLDGETIGWTGGWPDGRVNGMGRRGWVSGPGGWMGRPLDGRADGIIDGRVEYYSCVQSPRRGGSRGVSPWMGRQLDGRFFDGPVVF